MTGLRTEGTPWRWVMYGPGTRTIVFGEVASYATCLTTVWYSRASKFTPPTWASNWWHNSKGFTYGSIRGSWHKTNTTERREVSIRDLYIGTGKVSLDILLLCQGTELWTDRFLWRDVVSELKSFGWSCMWTLYLYSRLTFSLQESNPYLDTVKWRTQ